MISEVKEEFFASIEKTFFSLNQRLMKAVPTLKSSRLRTCFEMRKENGKEKKESYCRPWCNMDYVDRYGLLCASPHSEDEYSEMAESDGNI